MVDRVAQTAGGGRRFQETAGLAQAPSSAFHLGPQRCVVDAGAVQVLQTILSREAAPRANKNNSFARGFQVVMADLRSGRNRPSALSARNQGSLRAKRGSGSTISDNWRNSQARASAQRRSAVAAADAQGGGRILVRQAGEVAELHEPGRVGIVAFQPAQGLVEGEEVVGGGLGGGEILGKFDARPAAAVLLGLLAAGLIDQDAAHRLGGGGKEVAAAVPVLGLLDVRPAGGRPRGPGPSPGASGPASPGRAFGPPSCAARRRRAASIALRHPCHLD